MAISALNPITARYRGDRLLVDELEHNYRIRGYLAAHQENLRQHDQRIREMLLTDGIRLTAPISPRVYGIYEDVAGRLGFGQQAEIFCLPSERINAMAILDQAVEGEAMFIGLTSAALERLEDAEIASVIGHEIGHFLFEHNILNALLSRDPERQGLTVLPALGESLFLRWQKMAEISADRAGIIAAGDFESSARALIKATFGLSARNLDLNLEVLLKQIDEAKGSNALMQATFSSHPLLPIRLKALHLFASAAENASSESSAVPAPELEDQVDALIELTKRHPSSEIDQAVMRAVASGGVLVLGADGEISDDEVKVLIESLHTYFTDKPEDQVPASSEEAQSTLSQALEVIAEANNEKYGAFILSRLAEIALADGALLEEEGAVILEIAQQLNMHPRVAWATLMGATQALGFRVDAKLNRIASGLRETLAMKVV